MTGSVYEEVALVQTVLRSFPFEVGSIQAQESDPPNPTDRSDHPMRGQRTADPFVCLARG